MMASHSPSGEKVQGTAKGGGRLLYLINTFDIGGAEIGLLRLLDGGFFDSFASTSVVALSAGSGGLVPSLEERRARIQGTALSYRTLSDRPLTIAGALSLIPTLYRLVRATAPDVLLMSLSHSTVLGRVVGKLAGVPTLASFEHHTSLRREYMKVALLATSPAANVVLYDCEATREAARSGYYVRSSRRRWYWVPLFSSPPQEASAEVSRETPPYRVLTVGRLESVKNLSAAIRSVGELRASGVDVEYDIVGSGSLKPELVGQIQREGLEGAVRLAGFQSDWRHLAGRADVYLQPSLSEGACLVALEAMQLHLPVVATPVGGLVDYAREAQCVLLANGCTSADIAYALRIALLEPALRNALARRGFDYVQSRYAPDIVRSHYKVAASGLRT